MLIFMTDSVDSYNHIIVHPGNPGLDESDNDRTRDLGTPSSRRCAARRRQAKNARDYGISARKISELNAAIAALAPEQKGTAGRRNCLREVLGVSARFLMNPSYRASIGERLAKERFL
jgi:hypothetical protein